MTYNIYFRFHYSNGILIDIVRHTSDVIPRIGEEVVFTRVDDFLPPLIFNGRFKVTNVWYDFNIDTTINIDLHKSNL